MHKEIVSKTKEHMRSCSYFAFTCDEVTTVDNVSLISINAYVVHDLARIPML